MPYNNVRDLPKNVRNVLPLKAQRMYMHVYNSALGNYNNPYQIAWGVIAKHFEKQHNGKWKSKRYKSVSRRNKYKDYNDYDTTTDDDEYDETTDSTIDDYTDEYDEYDNDDDDDDF